MIINIKKLKHFHDLEHQKGKDLCLFHDKSFLKDNNQPENKDKVIEKVRVRIENSKRNKTSLKCIGYYLPEIMLIKEEFTQYI
jgi:hypothetical protein